ncbi:hypothetical protein G4H71_08840 [Rhodococcus triatomae]|uniref:Uncharacterized protein n=1 Tax=Rhodococcus triatomae TaxID=300028 RepID=A0A1G8I5N0_9NOCA|nr:hypothetical protein [Rhodococcus triatomae]QNG20960.1 hypothetical protein G4H72_21545 [Rhodococcus triatomae]QNG23125.1 hypothetical protein G4H71_08840 [Rhodococcus triatomae]SDI14137.1 hypothetical protein SAMN05444695_105165 [Rhodococcus triatomae]
MSTSIVVVLFVSTLLMALANMVAKPKVFSRPVARGTFAAPSLCDMSIGELEALIAVQFARERELRAADQVDAAREIGVHRFLCISELRSRH